jgi:hypothetical protein
MTGALIWSALTSRIAGPIAGVLSVVLAGCLAAALLGKAEQAARVERLVGERDAWKASAGRWRASFAQSEALRARETATADAAMNEAARACQARILAAQRSARAIRSIINQEVPHDAQGCPVRGLVPVERLRDALTPSAGAGD